HLADVLRECLRADRLQIVAGVEHLQIEGMGGPRAPQPQGVHVAGVIAGNHVAFSVPSWFSVRSVWPPKLTVTAISGCGNSHGEPLASQRSGCSTWPPSTNVCRKMPYS